MAVDIGVKAKATGLSAISLRNSGHVGRVGECREARRQSGLISIHFVSGSILPRLRPRAPTVDGAALRRRSMRAHARRARFCTRWSPKAGHVVSHGGKPLPPDALIGPNGALSGDPALLYGSLTAEDARPPAAGASRPRRHSVWLGPALRALGGSLTAGATDGPQFANGMFAY